MELDTNRKRREGPQIYLYIYKHIQRKKRGENKEANKKENKIRGEKFNRKRHLRFFNSPPGKTLARWKKNCYKVHKRRKRVDYTER